MIARLFLAVLGLGLALAQQEYQLYTNGLGGPECGKLHRCIKDATCELKDGLRMCECTDKNLVGNAKLQCLPREDHTVWIQNDPHLKNFNNEFSSLLTPCPYRVLNLVFTPEADTRVIVELYGQNTLFKGGHYFLTKLTLSTTVYLGNDMMKQVMEFEGDIHTDLDSQAYNYTLVARSLDTTVFDQPEGVNNVVSANDSRLVQYTMTVDKDAVDNLLLISIKGLGIRLFFRPPSTVEHLNNVELPMVPGALFTIKKDFWKLIDLTYSEFQIASFPDSPSLKDLATEHHVSKPVYVQYLLLANSTTEVGYDDFMCYQTYEIFHQQCKTEDDRLRMLQICSSVYADSTFLECLTEKHEMEEYINIQKEFFQRCERPLCLKDANECVKMKKEMPEFTGCPLPQKIQDLDCNSITGATARQGRGRFYFY
ncbi:hypothetical protein EGW08_007981 [Elysia chlorotica]|uniref:VWFD domain-containing protein n=1 Tax=Elysia chlorotica TaxID=188477 RepID=A0A3S1C6E6_ELYCH|nr:hypothetical protein EGW08_007981 [Elysia chlorotica]